MGRLFKIISIVIISTSSLFSQREMTITEMNSDDDVVLELVGEDPTATDYMLMNLGFNRSNEGWLRMRTDHDLSFYTNNQKRLTVSKEGGIGIGTSDPLTKLFVKNGDIGIETTTFGAVGQDERASLNFYTGSNPQASLSYCDCSADGGRLMNFSIFDEGDYIFKSDGIVRMNLDRTGDLSIDRLKGDGQRPLFAESDGTLSTKSLSKYQVISSGHFQKGNTHGDLIFYDNTLRPVYPLIHSVVAVSNPSIPYSKYEIEEIKVWYIDDSDESIWFTYEGPDSGDTQWFFSEGATSSERNFTFILDTIVDQEQGEDFIFRVRFNGGTLSFTKAVIKYRPIY